MVLITEHSKGSIFVLGFEKEEVSWLIEQLTKAIEMKIFMGFNRKFRGKTRVHLLEVSFNVHGRFIRLSKFTSNRKSTFLVIPEGDNGKGWELLKSVLYSMLVVPSSSFDENGRDEGSRKGGLVPVGRWVRVVVCECQNGVVNWAEVSRAMVRRLGHKGVVTIVPFVGGNGLFFVETLEEALSLQRFKVHQD
ncbi:hypothetical protein CK203_079545 [Vitis vinifera]|uniref:DUF4283 domain-containing protein n=1 Tax=Vitis vinifera TaxID=29760 RepID=A0A438CNW1_VITVI|nr:hypothetical protein CK203_079545 [Vitis vinifera]